MEYSFKLIEQRWQAYWKDNKTFKTNETPNKPTYYVLDMFPYPSGAGLHVGHPLGYIASDIIARYKKHNGFNVLHPMGYDSFGLPAEQYAIQTGQHPAVTTEENINRYRNQLDKIGFSFDWDREVRTSNTQYYKWTQWLFIKIFNAWFNLKYNKAEPIEMLIKTFETIGNDGNTAFTNVPTNIFSAQEWISFSEKQKSDILMNYRLAYLSDTYVNWCPQLGTVLANDEIKNGLSERGGFPVEKKIMKQWSMRLTAYAQRLLDGLIELDWTESIKEVQKNWIGKSEGAYINFQLNSSNNHYIKVFTTRPETIFGVNYIVLAPEHPLVNNICTEVYKHSLTEYQLKTKQKNDRERLATIANFTGVFTGAYVNHPFTNKQIPVWIADYVLADYGTGAVMAVPAHDSRDYAFSKQYNLPITQVINGGDISQNTYEQKEGTLINSEFLNNLNVQQAVEKILNELNKIKIGIKTIQYKLHDIVFGRQRYWGEPVPIYFKDDIPYALNENELPLVLPEIDKYLPTSDGQPPLARALNWKYQNTNEYEYSTMPGWAGSAWYFLRYMDATNTKEFVSKDKANFWKQIDLYIGGNEHATGHLLYFRFWTKILKDLGYIEIDEPAKKLINQGMILGRSNFVYRINGTNQFVSKGLKNQYQTTALHVDVNIVEQDILNLEAFKNWRSDFKDASFILENDKYVCGVEEEKMSKSKYNVVSPDDICSKYGADTLRMYEMFLGPLEQSKPWNTNGISGVHNFLKKTWRLFFANGTFNISADAPNNKELKVLHKTIKKITEDLNNFSFNTSVSAFMICVNELTELKCNKRAILEPLLICLAPYTPHIAEELWMQLGNKSSISEAPFPEYNKNYLVEDEFNYPISFNGKVKFNLLFVANTPSQDIEKLVLSNDLTIKQLNGLLPKRVIVVPNKIVNIVL